MKVLSCSVMNFGSYKDLTFDFSKAGLALIYGATGSGKSTFQDFVQWTLFGTTAKDGNVDEVRSWTAQEATKGSVSIQIGVQTLVVTRIRGTAKENDLYWEDGTVMATQTESFHRGKDLADTQKLINDLLGVNADTYNTATTFNEFSESGLFFLAKAKDKRHVFEKVANLSFPALLAAKTSEARKVTKRELDSSEALEMRIVGKLEGLTDRRGATVIRASNWDKSQLEQIAKFTTLFNNFEKEKASNLEALETKSYRFDESRNKAIDDYIDKLDALDQKIKSTETLGKRETEARKALPPHCPACGKANNTSDNLEKIKAEIEANNKHVQKFTEYTIRLRAEQECVNPYKESIATTSKSTNHYSEQLAYKEKEVNPFKAQLDKDCKAIPQAEAELQAQIAITNTLRLKYSSLDRIYELSFVLRGQLLKTAVKAIQDSTNGYLERHFDSEFKVSFELVDADNLEVEIRKNGYLCVYKQLSKGQRQLLKLCFSVSVMLAAANNVGISFNLLTFDESLDGLDGELKVKAYGLFEDLAKEHPSVLVIDHNESFQELFSNRYKVTLVGDESLIEYE